MFLIFLRPGGWVGFILGCRVVCVRAVLWGGWVDVDQRSGASECGVCGFRGSIKWVTSPLARRISIHSPPSFLPPFSLSYSPSLHSTQIHPTHPSTRPRDFRPAWLGWQTGRISQPAEPRVSDKKEPSLFLPSFAHFGPFGSVLLG